MATVIANDVVETPVVTTTPSDANATQENGQQETTQATTEVKKTRKKRGPALGSKRANARIDYERPETGIAGNETPGFLVRMVGGHKKLTKESFVDPLNFLEWQVWYHQKFLDLANVELVKYRELGPTPEARAENVGISDSLTQVEDLVAVAATKKTKLANSIMDRLIAVQAATAKLIADALAAEAAAQAEAEATSSK